MARSGDDTDADAISRLRRQLADAENRLSQLENAKPAELKRQLGELQKERSADRARQKEQQQEAARKTKLVEGQIKALDAVLASALARPPLAFDHLRADQDRPAPDPADYQPRPPGLTRFLPGAAGRHEEAQQEAQARYDSAHADHLRALEQAAQHNSGIETRRTAFAAADPAAVEWFIGEVLRRSPYPEGFPRQHQVSYQADQTAVVVDLELPPPEIVPQDDEYQPHPDRVRPVRRPEGAVRQQYKRLIACIALRTLHEIFAATSPYPGIVRDVTLTGWASGREEAVGESRTAQLVAVSAGRDAFVSLQLADVQPAECLTSTLGAQLSSYPYGLVPAGHSQPPQRPSSPSA